MPRLRPGRMVEVGSVKGRCVVGRAVLGVVAGVAVVIGVGWLAVALLQSLVSVLAYVIVGALVVGGGVYVYGRVRRSLAPGTRNQRRLEAAVRTYRMRNR